MLWESMWRRVLITFSRPRYFLDNRSIEDDQIFAWNFRYIKKEMVKIEVLKNNRVYMEWLGIYPDRIKDSKYGLFTGKIAYIMTLMFTYTTISSIMILCKSSSDMTGKLNAIVLLFVLGQTYIMLPGIGRQIKNIADLHHQIQGMVNKGLIFLFFSQFSIWVFSFRLIIQLMVMKRSPTFIGTLNKNVENLPKWFLLFSYYSCYLHMFLLSPLRLMKCVLGISMLRLGHQCTNWVCHLV